jgi:hypothetical protein
MSNPQDPNDPYGTDGTEGGTGGPGDVPPPPPPYGQSPYGQPGQPAGQGAYGQPYGQGDAYGQPLDGGPAKTDTVSIIGFVLSLTCCLSIVGAIMGGIGLGRTKNNQRKGRWAAISALVIGILGTLAFAGIVVFGVFLANSIVTPDNAEVGTCVDVTEDADEVSFIERDCGDEHDAEVVAVDRADAYPGDLEADDTVSICTSVLTEEASAALDSAPADLDISLVIEDPSNVDPSDRFICYAERSDGDKLTGSLLP